MTTIASDDFDFEFEFEFGKNSDHNNNSFVDHVVSDVTKLLPGDHIYRQESNWGLFGSYHYGIIYSICDSSEYTSVKQFAEKTTVFEITKGNGLRKITLNDFSQKSKKKIRFVKYGVSSSYYRLHARGICHTEQKLLPNEIKTNIDQLFAAQLNSKKLYDYQASITRYCVSGFKDDKISAVIEFEYDAISKIVVHDQESKQNMENKNNDESEHKLEDQKVLINTINVKENETTKAISKIVQENKEIPQIKESGLDSVIKCLQNYTENEENTDNKSDSDNKDNNDSEYQRKLEDRKVLIESVTWQQKLYKNNENAIKEVKTIEANLEKQSNMEKEKHENFVDVNEAVKCTKEILSNVNGNLSDKNTLFQMITELSPGAMFYDPKKATSFANSNSNTDDNDVKSNEQPSIVLKLSTVPGLDIDENSSGNNKQEVKKAQKQLISEMKYTLDKKDTKHPILEKTRKSLAEAYGVDIESVVITNVYYGSCCFEYTIDQSEKHKNYLTDPKISEALKEKFRYFESNKIHPSMFDAFDVNDFDLRGNKNFSSENSTYEIGPPNKKQAYKQPNGWTRYGLKVLGEYPDGDAWLHPFDTDKSWYRAYHGVTGVSGEDMSVAKIIKDKGFLPGRGQAYAKNKDIEGRTVGKGVYCTPNINLAADGYGGNVTLKLSNGTSKKFRMVFQVCVNPKDIRIVKGDEDYWIAPNEIGLLGHNKTVKDNIRPYGILLQEV